MVRSGSCGSRPFAGTRIRTRTGTGTDVGSNDPDYTGLIDGRLDGRLMWAIVAVLLLIHAVLAWSGREIAVLTAQDDVRYLLLGESLRDLAYRDLFLVGSPPHNVYPPGYPAFLAPWGMIGSGSFASVIVSNIIFSTAALGLAFAAIRRVWSATGAILCLTCLAVNPFLVARAGGVRSESLYMFLTLLALWALTWKTASPRRPLIAGAAAVLAGLTRTVGVSLIAAIGVGWMLRRRQKAASILIAAAAATVGAWLLWSALAPGQYEGVHYFAKALTDTEEPLLGTLVRRFSTLVPNYGARSTPWVLALPTISGTSADNVLWAAIVAVGIIAGLFEMLRRWPVVTGYLLLYALILVFWPYYLPRFLEPAVPLLVPTLLLGLGLMTRRLGKRWSLGVIAAMALLMTGGGLSRTLEAVSYRRGCEAFSLQNPPACIQEDRASYLRALHYVDAHAPTDAVFMTGKPETLYYYTGRRSVLIESVSSAGAETLPSTLRERGVDYVLLGNLHVNEIERLHPALQQHCESFSVEAFFEPRTYLLRVGETGEGPAEDTTARGATARGATAGGATAESDACAAMAAYERDSVDRDFNRDNWRAN